jgi:hypothetical protein
LNDQIKCGWKGRHVACIYEEKRIETFGMKTYQPLGSSRHKYEDNNKMDLKQGGVCTAFFWLRKEANDRPLKLLA